MGSKALDSGITPLHVEIALHYFKSKNSGDVVYNGRSSDLVTLIRAQDNDAAAQICHEFADAGLLEIADDHTHWRATNAMRLYIEALCGVPLPAVQSKAATDITAHLDEMLRKRGKSVGDVTIKTRSAVISEVMNEFVLTTPKARL